MGALHGLRSFRGLKCLSFECSGVAVDNWSKEELYVLCRAGATSVMCVLPEHMRPAHSSSMVALSARGVMTLSCSPRRWDWSE